MYTIHATIIEASAEHSFLVLKMFTYDHVSNYGALKVNIELCKNTDLDDKQWLL